MKRYFDIKRCFLVVRRDGYFRISALLVSALTLGGVIALLTLLSGLKGGEQEIHGGLYRGLLFIGGFLTASGAFKEMHTGSMVHDWLMLPASSEEKFLSRLLLSTFGYWIFISIVYISGVLFGDLLLLLLARGGNALFNPLGARFLGGFFHYLPHYLILQSIFIAGGAVFRKHQFLKTILFLSLAGILVGIFTVLSARMVFGEVFSGNFSFDFDSRFANGFSALRGVGEFFFITLRILYFGFLAPFCWLVAYLRVREAEVRYAL